MNLVKVLLEVFKELLPLIKNYYIYNKGVSKGKDIVKDKIKDNVINNLKEQNEILKELQKIDKDINSTNDRNNLFDRL